MPAFDKIAVVIPSLNPDDKLLCVVNGLISRGFCDLIVVNDGSAPNKTSYFETITAFPECTVLTHEVNRGKGRALKTAFAYILEQRPNCIGAVTVDGDNQHHPDDVSALATALIKNNSAFILGARDFSQPDVPVRSRLGNRITAMMFGLLCRQKISDTQTGLRALPRKIMADLLTVTGERFDFETNMLLFLNKNRIPIHEISIRTIYFEENATSHFRAIFDSLSILRLIFAFAFSSSACAALDLGCYWLTVSMLTALPLRERVLVGTVISRAISSAVNFSFNRKAVFGSNSTLSRALPRYYLLCFFQFICSWVGVWGLTLIIGGSSMLSKIIIDVLLFFASFNIQRRWVFSEQND
ncbi:MAG: bifunctional glycosyltransferase family 2/GtrA family protein [Candidatus Fimivivens sp.]|nr:bifunctional glycosyltransferase family 2/GtrA family protein [Candidatus Fimivivens sp.]